MKEQERSRRRFLEVSSLLGLGIAFRPRAIAEAFAYPACCRKSPGRVRGRSSEVSGGERRWFAVRWSCSGPLRCWDTIGGALRQGP